MPRTNAALKPEEHELLLQQEPRCIQRCILDREEAKLRYEYMGSTEFEVGDQAKSLRRMLEGKKVEIHPCKVTYNTDTPDVDCYLVANTDFPFDAYPDVIQGLIERRWNLQEPTYLDIMLERRLGLVDDDRYSFAETETWFDFQNDVLFTFSEEDAQFLLTALDNIKESWRQKDEWLKSAPVASLRKELEKVRTRLAKVGKHWFSLKDIKEWDGELKIWLNPADQEAHNYGWYTLQELRDWIEGKGPIMKSEKKRKK